VTRLLIAALTVLTTTGGQGAISILPTEVEVVEVGDEVTVSAFEAESERRADLARPPGQRTFEYERTADCLLTPASSAPCPQTSPESPPLSLTCEDGPPVAPLWRRRLVNDGTGWNMRSDWACPSDLLPQFGERDLRRLKIEPLTVNQQPSEGPMLVTKPVIVYAEPAEREYHVVLFGTYGVDVVVSPVEYTWDFGDGETLSTREPGRPYPAFDLTHVYGERGNAHITLTTTWSAKYRLDDDPAQRWREAEGTAVTVDQGVEFDVIELRTKLVD